MPFAALRAPRRRLRRGGGYPPAFGEEPGDIIAIGRMTDPGDDGSPRRTFYGDYLGHHRVWGLSGPFFGFSDTWQLIVNTSTTIVTS